MRIESPTKSDDPSKSRRLLRVSPMRTVDLLLEELDLTVVELAEQSGLPPERVEAIATGRWTPSPAERAKLAQAFGVPVEAVSWGHTMDPRNVRYRRFGLKEDF
jgi:transcriptional regulator with XRE-family HTH domain